MASLQILKYSSSLLSISHPNSEFNSHPRNRKFLSFQIHRSSTIFCYRSFRISSKLQGGDNQTNGEEPPESLFTKELRKRGMNPTSLLEESNRGVYADEEMKLEEKGGSSKRNALTTDYEKRLSDQRERSMALNSEGLEGLIPRAKLLLSIGGTFSFAFWPLILITIAFFSALFLYLGPSFVHDASNTPITPPQYIDPYTLLEEERISRPAPQVF